MLLIFAWNVRLVTIASATPKLEIFVRQDFFVRRVPIANYRVLEERIILIKVVLTESHVVLVQLVFTVSHLDLQAHLLLVKKAFIAQRIQLRKQQNHVRKGLFVPARQQLMKFALLEHTALPKYNRVVLIAIPHIIVLASTIKLKTISQL